MRMAMQFDIKESDSVNLKKMRKIDNNDAKVVQELSKFEMNFLKIL